MEGLISSFAIILNSILLYNDDLDDAKDHHRIVNRVTDIDALEMIAVLNENDMLVKVEDSEIQIGRYPKFGEIVVAYLKRGIKI